MSDTIKAKSRVSVILEKLNKESKERKKRCDNLLRRVKEKTASTEIIEQINAFKEAEDTNNSEISYAISCAMTWYEGAKEKEDMAKPKPPLSYDREEMIAKAVEKAKDFDLRAHTSTNIKMDSSDLSNFVLSVFGKRLGYQAVMECGNDEIHDFNVTGEVYGSDLKNVEAFFLGDEKYLETYKMHDALNFLCKIGLLPQGDYLIEIAY